jgi:hypothetical protein
MRHAEFQTINVEWVKKKVKVKVKFTLEQAAKVPEGE